MAKTKTELFKDAADAGLIGADVTEDDYTTDELRTLLTPVEDRPAWAGSMSAAKPLVSPDGHVHLSQEDINARR